MTTHSPLPSDATEPGLSSHEAARRLAEHGHNRLPEPPTPGIIEIFARQFLSPFIYILVVAAAASFVFGQLANGVFIVAVLLLNAVIGAVQEHSAQRSAAALRNLVRGEIRVVRDGHPQKIDVHDVVPGDYVLLASGDKVPADLRLTLSTNLAVDESMLTGESMAVTKNARAQVAEHAPLAERFDRMFGGTIVTRGRGAGVVTETGSATQIGRIAGHVSDGDEADPPLIIRIRRFTYQVATAIMIAIVVLVALMLLRGGYGATGIVMMVIGLAVSTIPEGLPAALTVALAIGMRRMARGNVIIRKLVAVEALGSCTFICSDKTGTLTVNELTIRRAMLPDGSTFEVTGEGIAPGRILGAEQQQLRPLVLAGLLANESHLEYSGGEWVSDGDIVDVAFLVLGKKLGMSLSAERGGRERIDLIPYESERAFSGSLHRDAGGASLYVKGSPEKVLSMCASVQRDGGRAPIDVPRISADAEKLARDGYRVIALAWRETGDERAENALDDLVFLGLVGMIDPIRPDARAAIQRCRDGGIGVAMITGDHPATARAIALELGMCTPDDEVVTGAMIRAAGDDRGAVDGLVRNATVFARIEPTQKETIVDSLQRAGHFVAVTGDGVNDAPAMKHAHAGVAMGKRGTDVAKETADLIITDDRFASLVDGIEQGRIVYNNIRKVIALLIATGFSALLLFFLTVTAGLPMPLTAVQLLWLNLVANGLQDVALAFEPGEGQELDRRPRDPAEPIFDRHIIEHVLVIGGVMGVLAFTVFAFSLRESSDIEHARNLTLMLMVLFGNIHALSSRSETRSLFRIRFFANPFLVAAVPLAQAIHIAAMYLPGISDVLSLIPVSLTEWGALAAVALLLLVTEETHKMVLRRRAH